jgi:hypothetical protein
MSRKRNQKERWEIEGDRVRIRETLLSTRFLAITIDKLKLYIIYLVCAD